MRLLMVAIRQGIKAGVADWPYDILLGKRKRTFGNGYAILTLQSSGEPEYVTGGRMIEEVPILIQLFDKGKDAFDRIDKYLRAVEDLFCSTNADLATVTNGVVIDAVRVGLDIFEEPDPLSDGSIIWQGALVVEFMRGRNDG